MKKIYILLIISISGSLSAQYYDSSIYVDLFNFYRMKKCDLEINQINLKEAFHIKELVDSVNNNNVSIYLFNETITSSHATHIVVIENGKRKIYDIKALNFLIKEIIELSEKHDVCCSVTIRWIDAILELNLRASHNSIYSPVISKKNANTVFYYTLK